MIRDGKDGSGILPITVWAKQSKEIIDNETGFKLTNVALKNYYGNKLSTMPNTKLTKVDATQFIDLRSRRSKILKIVIILLNTFYCTTVCSLLTFIDRKLFI